ncbi:hypothetical protein [Microbacterium terrisoli]|jgi:hypothetical protein|uniref:hypothetical protein n=1 Tax=Microbacterium terrisoli TaxID=3242192 RepID=UPI00280491BE|nr:hypothetical protein [Microbacterium protaetiae]
MDNAEYDEAIGKTVRSAILATVGSVNGAARESGIAYTTLDRKLRGLSSFKASELRRLAKITGRSAADFLPREVAA